MSLLNVVDLSKYWKDTKAVDSISFELKQNEILGLLGPNGAGKTTTIRMLISVLKPSSGTISYFDKELSANRSEVLSRVAFASTYTNLPLFLTVEENLIVHGILYGMQKEDRKARIKELLTFFEVNSLKDRRISQISAGQKTKVMLVKAFLPRPEIVLLDEPTASLDPEIGQMVRTFIRTQRDREGVSVLFSSHNMDEVTELCDRALVMRLGKIVAEDSPKKLAATVAHTTLVLKITKGQEYVRKIIGERNLQAEFQSEVFRMCGTDQQICETLEYFIKGGVTFNEISVEPASLEDFFLNMARAPL